MRCISLFPCLMFMLSWGSVRTLPHVKDYDIIRPERLTGRAKRSLSPEQEYPEELQYALTIDGNKHEIHLEKNRILIGKNYTEIYYLDNGTEVTTSPNYGDHCYYHGHIPDVKDSSVSVGICSGIRGFLRAEQQVYLIEPLDGSVDGDHAVYRQEHLIYQRSSCGNSNESFYDQKPSFSGLHNPNSATSKFLFDGKKRFVELFIVVDNAEYKFFGRSMEKIKARVLEVANHVDKVYRPLNIRVMLIGLEVWSHQDQIDISDNADDTLTRFLKWRQDTLINKAHHDNAQLITGIDFVGDTVGLAPTSGMCTGMSGAVNQDHNINAIGVASTMAHEMGHNLGMSHDHPVCACGPSMSSTNCIMSSTVGSVFPEAFSKCSRDDLGTFLENNNPSCLLKTPQTHMIFGGPVCGNAFLELGEECDCGTEKECRNPCCNATTCRLTKDAQCAEGECCEKCRFKQTGSVCRESANECDLAEYCSGETAQCPEDVFRMNGMSCNFGQGYCYNGQCPSYSQHCIKLWGSGAQVGEDRCFRENMYGKKHAYCKKTRFGYDACTQQNMKCGKIFCTGGKDFPITREKVELSRSGCKIAVDNSGTEDVGMVPTGTKCGDRKVCYENACQDIQVYGADCSDKCNNHGVCNHKRKCHCDPGWAPPYCEMKVEIGQEKNWMAIGVSVAVTIFVLIILVVGGFMYCRRRTKVTYTSKCSFGEVSHSSGLSNPLFLAGSAKNSPQCGPPRVSQPTFVESSSNQVCSSTYVTVIPSRAPPQPPKKLLPEDPQSNSGQLVKPNVPPQTNKPQAIPLPPTKPLPPLHVKQVSKTKPPPLVPPVKPTVPRTSGN